MKSLASLTNVQDFLQDASECLEETLATEKLSRLALEHRTRLMIKLTSLMKERPESVDMYIDMKSDPTLRSFFSSDSSTSDSSSLNKEMSDKATVAAEEFYDVPVCLTEDRLLAAENRLICWSNEATGVHIKMIDQSDNSLNTFDIYKNNSSLQQFVKVDDAASVARRSIFMEELLHDGKSLVSSQQINPDVDDTVDCSVHDTFAPIKDEQLQTAIYNNVVSSVIEESPKQQEEPIHQVSNPAYADVDVPDDVFDWQNGNESDGISLRSATSDYSSNNQNSKWNIPAADAKMQAIRYGFMKRRNGRKLLSAWRRCYAVLLPTQLLMYSNNSDNKPRTVVDLTGNMQVSRLLKHGMDTKLMKMHPFVLLQDEKPIYEMSTKSREETDGWITSLQKVFTQMAEVSGDGNEAFSYPEDNIYDENVYEDLPEQVPQQQNSQRLSAIQGRNLPSLPHDSTDSPVTPVKSSKFNLFKLAQAKLGKPNTEVIQFKNDKIKVTASPTPSATPYSSLEKVDIKTEDIYNSIDDVAQSEFDTSTLDLSREDHLSKNGSASSESDLPIYDIPPPTVRPLSVISSLSDDGSPLVSSTSFARQISLRRANLLGRKAKICEPAAESPAGGELYDIPVSPRRIQEAETAEKAKQDHDSTMSVSNGRIQQTETDEKVKQDDDSTMGDAAATPQGTRPQTKIQKMTQYWQEKMDEAEKGVADTRKKESPSEKATTPSKEIKSVGRSFSRPANQRPALTTLTQLISSSIIKASKLKKSEGDVREDSDSSKDDSFARGTKPYQSQPLVKKEPPPRPPAPTVRINPPLIPKKSVKVDNWKVQQQSDEPVSPKMCEEYRARWAYVAQNAAELSINSGEVVKVVNKSGPCWLVKSRNKKGLVPKEYFVPSEGTNSSSMFSFSGRIGETVEPVS